MLTWLTTSTANAVTVRLGLSFDNANDDKGDITYTVSGSMFTYNKVFGDFTLAVIAHNGTVSGTLKKSHLGVSQRNGDATIEKDLAADGALTEVTPGSRWTARITDLDPNGFRISLGALTGLSAVGVGNNLHYFEGGHIRIHYDAPPAFANDAATRAPDPVAENATATTNIATLDATDPNQVPSGSIYTYPVDTVSYSVTGGADSAKFTIADTNKLRFSSFIPNFEDPQDVESTTPTNAASNNQYIVVVTATSGSPAQTVTQTLTVTVTDAAEPPAKPAAPRITSAFATPTQLGVSWTAPTNTGKPAITDYDVQYKQIGAAAWSDGGHTGTGTSADLTGLTSGTAYEVRVRATNDEGTSAWSDSTSSSTATNAAPTFDSADTAFSVAENSTAVTIASASDADDTVSYAKSGADSAKFRIDASSGAVTFASAPNFEDPASAAGSNVYIVTVTATSGENARALSVSKTLTVTVTNVAGEVPGKPAQPTVTRWTTTSIAISWDAPSNPGPPITNYRVNILLPNGGNATYSRDNPNDRTWTFPGLLPSTSQQPRNYVIKVRATNADGLGPWSTTVTVMTDNSAPAFSSDAHVSVAENTPVSTPIATVVATDGNEEDEITYTLSGPDSGAFTLDASSGVLKFRVSPDFEAPADDDGHNTYIVIITATSGIGRRQLSTTQWLTVTVTNVDEMNIGLAIGSSASVIDERYVSSEPSWTVTFDFSEPLVTEGDAAFTVADISVSGAGSATFGELTLTDAARAIYSVPVSVTAEGGYTFQVKSGSVAVARGDSYGSAGTPLEVVYNTPPVITDFALVPPPAGGYTVGSELALELTFDDDAVNIPAGVARAERPYIVLYLGEQTDANRRYAYWKSARAANSTIVTFTYEVQAGDVANVVHWEPRLVVPATAPISNGVTQIVTTAPADTGTGPGGAPGVVAFPGETAAPSPGAQQPPAGPISQDTPVVGSLLFPPTEETVEPVEPTQIPRTPLIFNEIGNGAADANDWLELRNVTDAAVPLKDWGISIVVDGEKEDKPLVVFPSDSQFSIPPNGILLLTSRPPDKTRLAGGIDITNPDEYGAVHRYFVAPEVTLPDDGQFLLLLRHAKGKLGTGESLSDVAGGGGPNTDAFIADTGDAFQTDIWPLKATVHPRENTEASLVGGKVWQREKADIVGYHKDAWSQARYTGVGYKRRTAMSEATAGTPGYPNDAVKAVAAPGSITFSELMVDSAGGTLPQWVELYNASKTEAVNLNRWELEIQNVDSEELIGRPIVRLTLQEKVIQPNQTLLIVTGDARASSADVFPAARVYNLLELHDKNLRIKKPQDTFLSVEGFTLKLLDRTGEVVDTIGNTDGNRRTNDTPAWALPMSPVEASRSSLIRRYENGVAEDGKVREGWVLSANINSLSADVYYGHKDDIGTPGYREGGALPVELAHFHVARTEAGVVIKWATASEVDNAGFILWRSLTRDSGFTRLNTALIAGAGTTGERQEYTFTDTSAKPGVEYYYQLEEVAFDGKRETLAMRMLRGAVSAANRRLTTFGAVKQREE